MKRIVLSALLFGALGACTEQPSEPVVRGYPWIEADADVASTDFPGGAPAGYQPSLDAGVVPSAAAQAPVLSAALLAAAAPTAILAIIPQSQVEVSNCYPFGTSRLYAPFMGFIYRNVPAFTLKAGDKIAFDLGSTNDVDIHRDIYFAAANKNPTAYANVSQGVRATAWVKVVSVTQTPENARGNATVGDYELVFTAEAAFTFQGGGFLIGFAPITNQSSPAYDVDCGQVLAGTRSTDASGYFYARFYEVRDRTLDVLDDPLFINNLALAGFRVLEGDPDSDGDGLPDSTDNCPQSANPEQVDTDADAEGDTCDPDDDGDTVADAEPDNCPLLANTDQADEDGDAMGDACEVQEAQAITFAPLGGKTFGDPDFTLSAAAGSRLAVSFTAAGQCTVSLASVHLTGAGTCTITAHQAGNTSYLAAEPVSHDFAIARAAAVLSLSGLSHTYDGSPKSATATSAPASLTGVALTYDGSPAAPSDAGTYAVSATLTHEDYEAEPAAATLTILPAPATISVSDPQPVYDGTSKDAIVTTTPSHLAGLAVGYSLNGSPVAVPVDAGSYEVTASLNNPNYEAGDAGGTLTIQVATPTMAWAIPAPLVVGTPLGAGQLNAVATGVGGESVAGSFIYAPAAGTVLPASPSRTLAAAFTSADPNYGPGTGSVQIAVLYSFTGFFQPVDNPGTTVPYVVNRVKAGAAVPVKFSMGGDQGLDIFTSGNPASKVVACGSLSNVDPVEQTVTAGSSSLSYDAATGQYSYVWKTEKAWAGACRQLTLGFRDGTTRVALFNLAK